jgi:undecaprenyl-diphosphatase
VVVTVLAFGIAGLHLLLSIGIPLALAVSRRWSLLGIATLGWVLSDALRLAAGLLVPAGTATVLPRSGLDLAAFAAWPPAQTVATSTCILVILWPHLNRPWRRFGVLLVAAISLLRVISSTDVVLDLVLSVGIGGAVGTALLLAFGRRISLPTGIGISGALDRIGLYPVKVEPVDTGSSLAFVATLQDGARLYCKVLARQQYEADSLLRTYRGVRMRELGEDVAYSTVRRAASVEAMLAMSAARAGVRTPMVAGVAPIADNEMVIAFEMVAGQRLCDVPPERVTDDVLAQMWAALAALRSVGIAHRDLKLSSWMLDDQEQVWLIDYSFGEAAAADGPLSADIAELLAATYAVVGAERAVAAAVGGLGPHALAGGVSHLVPVALSRDTRTAVKANTDGLDPLVAATVAACGITEAQFAPIERVKPRTLVMAALMAVAVYVLLPQLADLPRMIEAIRDADPRFAVAALAASIVTYLGAGMAITGASPNRIRLVPATAVAVAATFVGALAPPGVAHAGLNVRFLQKQGLPAPTAISATAAKEVAVGVVHVVVLAILAIIAGSSGALREELDRLPSIQTVGIVLAVLLAVIGVAAAIPKVRALVRDSMLPAVRESVASLRETASSPALMVTLFTGGLILQLGYIAALYFAVTALGGGVGFVTVGLIYLTVGSAASVAPTPGGVGAVEAVLLAALTGVGLGAATALAAVFLFRLVTFWIPIPIGGLSFRILASRELL